MWSWPFDVIIFVFLIAVGAFLVEVATDWSRYKKHPYWLGVIGALFVSWLVIFYGSFIEPRLLIVTQEEISLSEEVSGEIRVAVVADFHVGPYTRSGWEQYVVDEVMAQEPDMILIPGDFIFNHEEQVEYLESLSDLSAPLGVYAVTGNHDYSYGAEVAVKALIEDSDLTLLENEFVKVEIAEESLVIAGVSDIWFEGDLTQTLSGLTVEDDVVLISHNPDAVLEEVTAVADLVVSGHTHGGQIRLPLIGPVPPLPTELGRTFDKGLFQYSDMQQLFITSGVGETGPRARLFNPPEINIISLSF
jgi:predicted MPP superfamily phosphohydrolase